MGDLLLRLRLIRNPEGNRHRVEVASIWVERSIESVRRKSQGVGLMLTYGLLFAES